MRGLFLVLPADPPHQKNIFLKLGGDIHVNTAAHCQVDASEGLRSVGAQDPFCSESNVPADFLSARMQLSSKCGITRIWEDFVRECSPFDLNFESER